MKTELYCNGHVAIVLDLVMGQEIAVILPAPLDFLGYLITTVVI